MKIGLEKEYFVLKDGEPCVVPKEIEFDESGILAEARGGAFNSPTDAVYSLKSSIHKLLKSAAKAGVELSDAPVMKVSRAVKIKAARLYAKPLLKYENMYGHHSHRNTLAEKVAGIHISFTNPQIMRVGDKSEKYNAMFDYISIFRKLDEKF